MGGIGVAAAQDARVETQRVEDTPRIETLRLTGSVSAPRTSQLSSAEAGQVASLDVALGDRVSQGERLMALDSREMVSLAMRPQGSMCRALHSADQALSYLENARSGSRALVPARWEMLTSALDSRAKLHCEKAHPHGPHRAAR